MQAIILAAGRGIRLADSLHGNRPKCLLEFGGESLMQRQLRALRGNGLEKVNVVVGYQAERIMEHVSGITDIPRVEFHYNPEYLLGSAISLHMARDVLLDGQRTLVMDADVLFHPEILGDLCRSVHRNCFLIDRNHDLDEEVVKIALRGGRMVDFRKQLAANLEYDAIGESVGFFSLEGDCADAVAGACLRYANQGPSKAPYEEALRDILLANPHWFGFEDVSGLPWIELDIADDVERARQEVLPAIERALKDH